MTREEAKKELSKMIFELGFEDNVDDKVYALNMAIKALSQEPCDDVVSREVFITRYRKWMKIEYGKIPDDDTLAIRVIKSLPSVTQKSGKWIPVSERLPEDNKQVLIQYRTRYRDDVNLFDVTSRADYNYWQGIGREIDVIAWMPLPEPYEPQESEE